MQLWSGSGSGGLAIRARLRARPLRRRARGLLMISLPQPCRVHGVHTRISMTCRSTPRAVSTARCRRGVPRKSIWYSGIVPDVLSVDRGTENGLCCRQVIYVERAVRAALGERQSERPPVFYTRSVHNTRIERFWPELNVRFTLLAQCNRRTYCEGSPIMKSIVSALDRNIHAAGVGTNAGERKQTSR